jgi:hypothetical protein
MECIFHIDSGVKSSFHIRKEARKRQCVVREEAGGAGRSSSGITQTAPDTACIDHGDALSKTVSVFY